MANLNKSSLNNKVLYIASTDIHLRNFHLPYLKWFRDSGYEVHAAFNGPSNFDEAHVNHHIAFERTPFSLKNLSILIELIKLLRRNKFKIIHCHTPTVSVLIRIAYIFSFQWNSFIFYTAHGFSFYKGGPKRNWLLFYPIEVLLSIFTNCIITMNEEDWGYLCSSLFRCRFKYNIDGIGINPNRLFLDIEDEGVGLLKKELGIKPEELVFLYIAEFNKRKNHQYIFRALNELKNKKISNYKFLFAGGFSTEKYRCESYAEENSFNENVLFLGYRDDISKIIALADIGVTSSKTEGLPIGVLELIYFGKPVLASEIRGHKEIIKQGENGFLIDINDPNSLAEKMELFIYDRSKIKLVAKTAPQTIDKFLLSNAYKKMIGVYKECLGSIKER